MYRKVKFSLAFKKECLDLIISGNHSINGISKQKGVSRRMLNKWLDLYNQKGLKGLLPKVTKEYPALFKLEVIKKIGRGEISIDQAYIDFDIGSRSTIINWQKRYDRLGFVGLQDKTKGKPRLMKNKVTKTTTNKSLTREEELLLENKSLKAELDYLKKLHALIQTKTSKEKKH